MIAAKRTTHHGTPGWLVYGRSHVGACSIFVRTKEAAEQIKAAIKANECWRIDEIILSEPR